MRISLSTRQWLNLALVAKASSCHWGGQGKHLLTPWPSSAAGKGGTDVAGQQSVYRQPRSSAASEIKAVRASRVGWEWFSWGHTAMPSEQPPGKVAGLAASWQLLGSTVCSGGPDATAAGREGSGCLIRGRTDPLPGQELCTPAIGAAKTPAKGCPRPCVTTARPSLGLRIRAGKALRRTSWSWSTTATSAVGHKPQGSALPRCRPGPAADEVPRGAARRPDPWAGRAEA